MITVVAATAGYKVEQHAEAIRRTMAALPVACKGLLISPASVPATRAMHFDLQGRHLPIVWEPLTGDWCPRGQWNKIEGPPGEWNLSEYSRFMLFGLPHFIETEFCIVCQSDGYGVYRQNWSDEFLEYDYIGAPWPSSMNIGRVGNGGFRLTSRRWLARTCPENHPPPFDVKAVHGSDDCYSCTVYRKFYEDAGLKIAPIDVALRFSLEHRIEEFPNWIPEQSFGFHGQFVPGAVDKRL